MLKTMSNPKRSQRGFSMLETLVTLLIIAIWLLGSAGVQTVAMKLTKSSVSRNQAILLASEVGERIENNKKAASTGSYVYDGSARSTPVDCFGSACSPAQLVDFDLYEIYQRATANNAKVVITRTADTAALVTYSVVVTWVDRRTGQTYATTGTDETGQFTSSKTIYKT
jgi:type IV pilus assembly protein PilV